MNTRLALSAAALALFALFHPPAEAQAQSADYKEGVKLYEAEKYKEALPHLEKALRANPRDPYARSYLSKCKQAIAQNLGGKRDLQSELAGVILPKVDFEEAPIGDVMAYLSKRAEELSGGKLVPNFIYRGSQEERNSTPITLSLRNVPLTEVIRYVGQFSRSKVSYEEYAVVIDPHPETVSASRAPEAKGGGNASGTEKKGGPFAE